MAPFDESFAAAVPGGTETPTLGYDTVFAVSLDGINAAIRQRGSSPKALNWPQQGPLQFGLTANFDDWQMVPSGDGAEIHFALPMSNLRAPYVLKGTPGVLTCDAAVAYIAVKLHVQPHSGPALLPDGTPLGAPAKGTKRHALKVRDVSPDPNDPIVSVIDIIYTKPLSDPEGADPIRTMVRAWATQHLADFEHVFAFVDLNDQIATGQWSFCKPHTSTYAYVDDISGTSGHLALLSMTSNDPMPSIQQVTSLAIPPGCTAAFLISPRRFLLDMVLPGILQMWPNLTAGDLVVGADCKSLAMKPGLKVTLPGFVAKDGNSYIPTLSYFTLEITGNEIMVHSQTAVEVSAGIFATCDSKSWFEVALGANAKGVQTFTYKPSRPPVQINGQYANPGIQILKTILTVIGIVLSVLSIIVDGAAGLVIAAALLVCLVGNYVLNNIGEAAKQDAPGLEDLRAAFTGPVAWTAKGFALTGAALHGALQLGGTLA